MKKYSLTLVVKGEGFEPKSVDLIESDSLREVLAKLPLVIKTISEKELEYALRHIARDDDIPF